MCKLKTLEVIYFSLALAVSFENIHDSTDSFYTFCFKVLKCKCDLLVKAPLEWAKGASVLIFSKHFKHKSYKWMEDSPRQPVLASISQNQHKQSGVKYSFKTNEGEFRFSEKKSSPVFCSDHLPSLVRLNPA